MRGEGAGPGAGAPGAMPDHLDPMMALASDELPADEDRWGLEVKWDGARAIAFVTAGRVRLESRNQRDVTAQFPELAGALGGRDALLDGEVVAFDPEGRPSFHLLARRLHVAAGSAAARARLAPVTYVAFDLLHLDGRSLLDLPYTDRRARLEGLDLGGPACLVPAYHVGDGRALLEATRARGLEGLMAKRLDSRYQPGRRSPHWRKVKHRRRQELVVGGWLPGDGRRAGTIGAVLVGYHEAGGLRYAGRVGSGFTEAELEALHRSVAELARPASPFLPPPELPGPVRRRGRFAEPALVVEVAFSEWSPDGLLRHPVYLGRRDDVRPEDVVREG
ncbi:MAG: non-homologous end-joining DNA ligase [Acidimicrobiales bacterium]